MPPNPDIYNFENNLALQGILCHLELQLIQNLSHLDKIEKLFACIFARRKIG